MSKSDDKDRCFVQFVKRRLGRCITQFRRASAWRCHASPFGVVCRHASCLCSVTLRCVSGTALRRQHVALPRRRPYCPALSSFRRLPLQAHELRATMVVVLRHVLVLSPWPPAVDVPQEALSGLLVGLPAASSQDLLQMCRLKAAEHRLMLWKEFLGSHAQL